jgi:hypothetical protein
VLCQTCEKSSRICPDWSGVYTCAMTWATAAQSLDPFVSASLNLIVGRDRPRTRNSLAGFELAVDVGIDAPLALTQAGTERGLGSLQNHFTTAPSDVHPC